MSLYPETGHKVGEKVILSSGKEITIKTIHLNKYAYGAPIYEDENKSFYGDKNFYTNESDDSFFKYKIGETIRGFKIFDRLRSLGEDENPLYKVEHSGRFFYMPETINDWEFWRERKEVGKK